MNTRFGEWFFLRTHVSILDFLANVLNLIFGIEFINHSFHIGIDPLQFVFDVEGRLIGRLVRNDLFFRCAFAHTGDNLGPQSSDEVSAAFRHVRERLPHAEVVGSTLNAFAEQLRRVKDQLPVVTQELGDTWIHGAGSDPLKISQFRALSRLHTGWVADGRASQEAGGGWPDDDAIIKQLEGLSVEAPAGVVTIRKEDHRAYKDVKVGFSKNFPDYPFPVWDPDRILTIPVASMTAPPSST